METNISATMSFNREDFAKTFGRTAVREGTNAVDNQLKHILYESISNPILPIDNFNIVKKCQDEVVVVSLIKRLC